VYYEEVIVALNKNHLKYLIVGGIAANLYGVHRLTRDLDLMIEINEENLKKFIDIMNKLGYSTNVSIEETKNLTAISFHHSKDEFKQVDIFIKNPINFNKAYRERKIIKAKRISFPCASKKDIIRMKQKAGRERDWIDIGALKRIGQ
jgi:hypothetical protein